MEPCFRPFQFSSPPGGRSFSSFPTVYFLRPFGGGVFPTKLRPKLRSTSCFLRPREGGVFTAIIPGLIQVFFAQQREEFLLTKLRPVFKFSSSITEGVFADQVSASLRDFSSPTSGRSFCGQRSGRRTMKFPSTTSSQFSRITTASDRRGGGAVNQRHSRHCDFRDWTQIAAVEE